VIALSSAQAETVDVLGVFKDWTAYKTSQAGQIVCYMASEPKKDKGNYTKRGRIYAIVSHRPSAESTNVVSIHAGYKYKEGSTVNVAIGKKTFTLFTHGDTAWTSTTEDDKALVNAIRSGSKMRVTGTSWRGTKTDDIYSLNGATAAHGEISKACGVK
jgi:hypothetical protein